MKARARTHIRKHAHKLRCVKHESPPARANTQARPRVRARARSFVQTKSGFEEERLEKLMEKAAARSTIRTTLDPLLEARRPGPHTAPPQPPRRSYHQADLSK